MPNSEERENDIDGFGSYCLKDVRKLNWNPTFEFRRGKKNTC